MQSSWYQNKAVIITTLILFFPGGVYLLWKYGEWKKPVKIALTTVMGLLFAAIIAIGATLPEDTPQATDSTEYAPSSQGGQPATSNDPEEKPAPAKPNYHNIQSSSSARFDDEMTYWIVIDTVDTSSDSFKSLVKDVITHIAYEDRTANFTVKIFDNTAAALSNHSQSSTDREDAQHFIAEYRGGINDSAQISRDDDAYQITYFPAAQSSSPLIGQYVGDEQFKPSF